MTGNARFTALPDKDQARWLDPAEAEFSAHGFEAASLNRILASAGISKGRSYYYFADKGTLFAATLERRIATISGLSDAQTLAAKNAKEFRDAAFALVKALTRALQQDETLATLVRILHNEAAAQQACASQLAEAKSRIGRLLRTGQAARAIRHDLPETLLTDIAFGLAGTIDGWFAAHGRTLPPQQEAALSDATLELILSALQTPVSS